MSVTLLYLGVEDHTHCPSSDWIDAHWTIVNIPWIDEPKFPVAGSDSYHWELAGFPALDVIEGTMNEARLRGESR